MPRRSLCLARRSSAQAIGKLPSPQGSFRKLPIAEQDAASRVERSFTSGEGEPSSPRHAALRMNVAVMWPGICYQRELSPMIGKSIGNYVIERILAQGGMGEVFVARDRVLGRRAAVKFISELAASTSDQVTRFLDEARITASLQHPNIVTIYDFGALEGRPYYVMELLSGCDLASVMRAEAPFATPRVGLFVEQICAGLQAAHLAGIVHRDLKPGNIFVLDGDPLRIKLMDFGVAKLVSTSGEHTGLGQVIGTPRYMSPEQVMGELGAISPRSDIYSLGIVLFEMLTGGSVFESQSLVAQLMMHVEAPVPQLRLLAPEVPWQVAELVESCLAKDPNERPQAVSEVAMRFAAASGMHRGSDVRELGARTLSDHRAPATLRDSDTEAEFDREEVSKRRVRPSRAVRPTMEAGARSLRLDKADGVLVNHLWLVLQKRLDFPKFVLDPSDLGNHSDFKGSSFASDLGASILEDADLTTKLLRIVNSAYASRFKGSIDSVQRAILILGSDRVRLIALSIILFVNHGVDLQELRVSESAISSLMRGEIAQQFAVYAQVSDAEQAMTCAMFHGLGRHLAIVYLPEMYDRIVTLSRTNDICLDDATQHILGLSFRKLGLGAAERWHLPKAILGVMANVPGLSGRWAHAEDRMVALAEFSSELCDIVMTEASSSRPLATANLLLRYRTLIDIDSDAVTELMLAVQESFERRYSSLLTLVSEKLGLVRQAVASAAALGPVVSSLTVVDTAAPVEATRVSAGKAVR